MLPPLKRRAACEFLATAGLACAVIGSGIAAQRLSPQDAGLQLLENSIATTLALVALLLALPGTHLNPVVTVVDWARGRMVRKDAAASLVAQVAGGILGTVVANLMFERAPLEFSTRVRTGTHLWLGEVLATSGLLVTVHGTGRSNPPAVPLAVGCYIGAAYWFTSSTSFANPAVTVARAFSDSFAGIAPGSVPGFVVAQALGAVLGCAVLALLFPSQPRTREAKEGP